MVAFILYIAFGSCLIGVTYQALKSVVKADDNIDDTEIAEATNDEGLLSTAMDFLSGDMFEGIDSALWIPTVGLISVSAIIGACVFLFWLFCLDDMKKNR